MPGIKPGMTTVIHWLSFVHAPLFPRDRLNPKPTGAPMRHSLPLLAIAIGMLASPFMLTPALATATFACEAADKNIPALTLEGHIPYTGNQIVDFKGEIEIEAGKTIALEKSDVKKFSWKKTMAFDVRKKSGGTPVEIEIRTKKGADETEFPGTYKVRAGKQKFHGKISCSGG